MKSLRVYLREPVSPPTRFNDDYTAEEKAAFREQFQRAADRYRRRTRLVGSLMALLFFSMFFVQMFPKDGSEVAHGIFLGGIALLFWAFPQMPFCPACHNLLRTTPRRFCPECGDRALDLGDWITPAFCRSCKKHLYPHKSRNFKIHACTHCGLMLDEKGL